MMSQPKWIAFEQKLTKYRIRSLLAAIIFISSIGLVGTLAWENFGQRVINPNYDEALYLEVEVEKRIIDIDGNETTDPLADATFVLYEVSEEPYRQVSTDAHNRPIGPTFTTNDEGRLYFDLPLGNYCLIEIGIPEGFGPELDDDAEPILRTCFSIERDENDERQLVLIRDEEEVERIYIYNRELSGDLIVEKEVVNEDGSELAEEQLEQEFTFRVHFVLDDEPFDEVVDYRIEDEDGIVRTGSLQTGETFTLRHGERAIFENLPVGLSYEVDEEVPDGFDASGTNTAGDIVYGEDSNHAHFTNTAPENDLDDEYLVVEKQVVGALDDPNRQFQFTITIPTGGESQIVYLRHGERWTSDAFPVGTPFTIVERQYEGFVSNPSNISGNLTAGMDSIIFRNHVVGEPDPDDVGSLEVSKRVIGDPERNPHFRFDLVLEGLPTEFTEDGQDYAVVTINGQDYRVSAPRWEYTFFLQAGQSIIFDNLPAGVNYRVTEQAHPDYIQQITVQEGTIIADIVIEVEFVNIYVETTPDLDGELEICKILTDEEFESDSSFNFELWIDDELYHEFSILAGECELIEDLPVGAQYRVREVDIPDGYRFVGSIREFGTITRELIEIEFTNEYAVIDLPVEKLWDLNEMSDLDLPSYIVVRLLANGSVIRVVEIRPDDETGEWLHVFENLPRYDHQGELIVYTIEEEAVSGWVERIEETEDGFEITNTALRPIVEDGIPIEKELAGDVPVEDPVFAFTMIPVDGAPMPEVNRVYITRLGTAQFGDITFTEAGVFRYIAREEIPADTGNIEFDTSVFRIEFIVEIEDDGQLVVTSVTITRDGEAVDEIVFINTYHEEDDPPPPPPPSDSDDEECPPDDPYCDEDDPNRPPPPGENRPPGDDGTDDDGDGSGAGKPPQSQPPQTGDDTTITVWLLLIGLSSMALLLLNIRRRMAQER